MKSVVDLIRDLVKDNHSIKVVLDNGNEISINHFDDYKNNFIYVSRIITDSLGTHKYFYYINVDKISHLVDK